MSIKQVIIVRLDLKMPLGKIAAQCAHAGRRFLTQSLKTDEEDDRARPAICLACVPHDIDLEYTEQEWIDNDHETTIVLGVETADQYHAIALAAHNGGLKVHKIEDCGRTVFKGVPTYTVLAIGPDDAERIDVITGHLNLL